MTQIASHALTLFPQLEAETGMSTGYRRTGGYWLARKPERMDELRRILDVDEKLARGQVAGTVTKRQLVAVANRLHDWRVSMNILSGGLGEPHLWEE